ncbi:hypothetical protein [Microbacterium xanthum]|uniref:hypothetical protein n=1 Tax=Microbacterium xanthum TaxID=3079794 RepID=UPI002AD27910|nr:hypothetical protein [Microbacterium sp. KSW-48]MDZ8172896.1 hypothetical protein [Microbacterium sp. KSW-48]
MRSIWVPMGIGYWALTAAIALQVAAFAPWPVDVVAFAAAGGALAAIIWVAVGALRMCVRLGRDQLRFDGWMWRDDISIRRDAVHAVHVVDLFDPRFHDLLWIRGERTYPRKLEIELASGETVGLPSTLGPRRLLERQAQEIWRWCSISPARERDDPAVTVTDRTPDWLNTLPWYRTSVALGVVALASGAVAPSWPPGEAMLMTCAALAGGLGAFARLARRRPRANGFDRLL